MRAGEPVTVAIDDTLIRRRGKKVWAASWSAAIPVLSKLVIKDTNSASRLWLAATWLNRWRGRFRPGSAWWPIRPTPGVS